jgi:hypothetical protein
LDKEHVFATMEDINKYGTEQRISNDTPNGIEDSVPENALFALDVTTDITDGSDVRSQRARTDGCQQSEHESRDNRDVAIVENILQEFHDRKSYFSS